jgi:2',3'-cyclic-nucleotide 2'-phosphodiesterase (5'-nucleotidase family)
MAAFRISGTWYLSGCILLASLLSQCSSKLYLKSSSKQLYSITQNSPVDSSVIRFFEPYKKSIDSQMNAVIGVTAYEITRHRPEGTLNNLFIDAMAEVARQRGIHFDFAHSNYKSLRVKLPKGDLKAFKVYELMPFENLLVTLRLSGNDVLDLFNYMAKEGGDPISNASFKIVDNKAADIIINGRPLNLTEQYTILTSDYVANGGDGAVMYLKSTNRKEYPIKVRDAILQYIKQQTAAGRVLNPKLDDRIVSDKPVNNE